MSTNATLQGVWFARDLGDKFVAFPRGKHEVRVVPLDDNYETIDRLGVTISLDYFHQWFCRWRELPR